MAFCLLPKVAEKFKDLIRSGKIDIEKLANMSSEERRTFFKDIVGEGSAKEINALFESKLLLKNQKRGLVNWAKQIVGMKPEAKNTLIDRIMNMKEILSPENETAFLQDLASKRLGTDISIEEANKIAELSDKVSKLESITDKTKSDTNLGRAKMDLTDYVNSLNPTKASLLTNIAGVPRSIMASLDLSAPLNQGFGMISRKQFYTSFASMFKYAKSEEGLKNLQADILTDPIYKSAKKSGLRLTNLGDKLEMREEQFMSTLVDKIPGVSASQRAYTGFLNKLRIDVFKDLVNKAELAGEDVNIGSKTLEDLANTVNNFTGGARVGKIEGAVPALNSMFFSPRKIMSTLQILNPRNYLDPKISPTARKAALRNLIGSLAVSMTVIELANNLMGEETEDDPRSTDFGKIKSGNNRMDFTGGNATYVVLLSRLLSGKTKNQKGELKELNNKIGGTSAKSLMMNALRYKLSPNASLIVDILSKENAIGEPKTIPQSVIDRFRPMFLQSFYELLEDDTSGEFKKAMLSIGVLFGGGLNTYKPVEAKQKTTPKKKVVPYIP